MQQVYEDMIQVLLGKGFGSVDGWFSETEINDLRKALLERYHDDDFRRAGIGNQFNLTKDTEIRNDKIHWLRKDSLLPVEQLFFAKMDGFVDYLNRTCFAGIREHEFHYAVYEPGSFYKRHKDQFNSDDRRKFSFVAYLSESWEPGDKGQLKIYTDQEYSFDPIPGRVIFFASELEHEVIPTNVKRLSLTGWLKTL